ncbi:MAG: acyl-CoA dehydrogenase [Myxococcaceae bacterium]
MTSGVNQYKADLRELAFVLLEQFEFGKLAGKAPFEAWGVDEAKAILDAAYVFAREVLGPLNGPADREGCRVENGGVKTPAGFKDAWKKLYEQGFKAMGLSPEHGGQGAPQMVQLLVEEILSGANTAFSMYPGLAYGAAELIGACGTPAQVSRYVQRMTNGTWGGTMCLTEPHAGSDVGAAKSTAKKNADGTYSIRGTKIFISGGDHDLAENIIHLVLARVDGAPVGTKGLSLFIVPRHRITADNRVGEPNDVQVASIEHKLGINASATCVLNFGDDGKCIGELVGTVENVGMSQMFRMMNGARIAVGLQSLGVMSSAFLNALEYAKDRKQGAHFTRWKDPNAPRVAIVEHPDVRRMLMDMKSHVEGIRALAVKLAWHSDSANALEGKDDEKAAYHKGQVELLTPLLKAFGSDEAFRVCGQAIQVFGGAGYLKDWPVEQYLRDAKIFAIYEGTNHIQAMDLVGRKLGQSGGANFQAFLGDVSAFVETHRKHASLGPEITALGQAAESVMQAAMSVLSWSQDPQKVALIPLGANNVLEMMSRLAVGWLLLQGGVLAETQLQAGAQGADKAFYEGKRYAALWFGRNVLPLIRPNAEKMTLEDRSAVEIPDAAFAAV